MSFVPDRARLQASEWLGKGVAIRVDDRVEALARYAEHFGYFGSADELKGHGQTLPC